MATSKPFVREDRYLVLRWDDLEKYLDEDKKIEFNSIIQNVRMGRMLDDKNPDPKFVCVKDTYPEYEMVWAAIEKRMTNES